MYIATMGLLGAVWLYFWMRFHDPFHPAIILLPMFGFLYGYMPWELQRSDPFRFSVYAGGDAVYRYQAITLGLIAALIGGLTWVTRGLTRQRARWRMLHFSDPRRMMLIAFGLGLVGMWAWITMIMNVGGLQQAYGSGYGGGWVSSGYIREMRYLGLVGALLTYVARTGKGMRMQDWAVIALCVTPTLTHAVLGARRGPLFLAMIVLIGGYIYFMRKRISIPLLVGAGLTLGSAMLFLVANRGSIHLGTDLGGAEFRDAGAHLLRWSSNEYLIGNSVVQYTDQYGAFYGRRELAWLIGRLLPSFIWPTVWTDLPLMLGLNINLRLNGGVSQEGLTTIANWTPSVGSAEGFTGSLYLEFGFLSPLAAFVIGVVYGKAWMVAKTNLAARVFYLLMVAMSVYLVMQALDPWLYRLVLFGLPTWLVLRTVKARPIDAEIVEGGRVQYLAPRLRKRGSKVLLHYSRPVE